MTILEATKINTRPPEPEAPPAEELAETPSTSAVPHNREVEEAVIGAVLINPDIFPDLAAFLRANDFYIIRHRWIWEAFIRLREKSIPVDFLTVSDELKSAGQLDEIGGPAYLTALLNQVPTSLHAVAYGKLVQDASIRRRMLTDANQLATQAYDYQAPLPAEYKPEEAGRPRFVIHQATEALQPHPPRQEIIKGLLSIKQLGCFYGEAGSKKSYSLMTLALAVATGATWLDFETQQARVLFLDEDAGEDGTRERVAECLRGMLIDDAPQFDYMSMAGLQLDQDADAAKLEAIIREGLYSLVILDAFGDLMSGDENSKEDTAPIMRNLRRVADHTEAALLFIHHANKTGGYRGSSHIKGKLDLMVGVTSENGKPFINFKTDKVRYGQARTWAAQANWGPGQFYLTGVDAQKAIPAPLSKSQEFVIGYLTDHGASSLPEVMAAADTCSSGTARNAIYSLASLGIVKRINPEAPKNEAAIYELSNRESNRDTTSYEE
jgi:hypothetical protein